MKKLFFVCFIAMVLNVLPPQAVHAYEDTNVTSDDFIYPYYDEIVGYDGIESTFIIPDEIESLPLLAIADEAFRGDDDIEEVVFEGNVRSIGYQSFYSCENLTTVTFCDSLETISEEAFSYCFNLKDLILPENLYFIGKSAFIETGIIRVDISENVSDIGDCAFSGCESLVSIEVADGNNDYSSVDGALYNKNQTRFLCCPAGKRSIELADSVVQIAEGAFLYAEKINTITLPESVSRIEDEAFNGTSIKQITIPKNVTFIGDYVFYGCTKLLNIEVESENLFYSSEDGVLYDKQKSKLICCPSQKTDIDIPKSVNEIGMASFACCDRITKLIIPDGVTIIGEEAFANADNLSYLFVPESVIEIGRAAMVSVLRIDCIAQSYAEEYAIEYELDYTIHKHTVSEGQVCIVCGKEIPKAMGKFALLKKFLQEKGENDSDGNKCFYDEMKVSNKMVAATSITYLEDDSEFEFAYGEISNGSVTSAIFMSIGENGSKTVTADYGSSVFSLYASATFEAAHYQKGRNEYFMKTAENILDNNEIQYFCNSTLKTAFVSWDLLLMKYLGFDVNMADMGFTSYEAPGTHTGDGVITKKPTCTEKGVKTYTCKICGFVKKEAINMTQHQWNKVYTIDKKATSTTTGLKSIHCSKCNTIKKGSQQIIPAENSNLKKSQNIKVAVTKKISLKKLKKKAQSFKLSATSTSGMKVKYKLKKKPKQIKFSASSGKITVKKGTKKGIYKIKVQMTVPGNAAYKEFSTIKTIKINVK